MLGQPVERRLDSVLVANRARPSADTMQPIPSLRVVGEKTMHVAALDAAVGARGPIAAAITKLEHRAGAVGAGRASDVHLVAIEGLPMDAGPRDLDQQLVAG